MVLFLTYKVIPACVMETTERKTKGVGLKDNYNIGQASIQKLISTN